MTTKMRLGLLAILMGGLLLNLWGNEWGLPAGWHPDEHFVTDAVKLVWESDRHTFLTTSLYVKTLAVNQFIYHSWAKQKGLVPANYEDIRELSRYSVRPGHELDASYVIGSYQVARSLSAVLAALTVLTTFYLGQQLGNRRLGLLAALLLTVCMGFMNLAHFATYDMFTILFVTATVYWSVRIVENGRLPHYLLAALFAALAASGKAIGYLAILCLVTAHLLWVLNGRFKNFRQLLQWRSHKNAAVGLLCFGIFYLFLNPVWLLEPETAIVFLQSVVGYVFGGIDPLNEAAINFAPRSNWVVGFFNMAETLGWPLFILMGTGLVWATLRTLYSAQKKDVVLLAWIVPYIILMGTSALPMIAARHMVPLFPFLAVFAAKLIGSIATQRTSHLISGARIGTVAVILYSLTFTAAAADLFRKDSRYVATEWLANHLNEEGAILVSGSPTIRAYFPTMPYSAASRIIASRNEDDWQLVAEEAPRFIIMSSIYYGRYFAWPTTFPEATAFHQQLIEGKLGYKLIAHFPSDTPTIPLDSSQTLMDFFTPAQVGWLNPQPEFVNPTILIFVQK